MATTEHNLEQKLLDYAAAIIKLAERMLRTRAGSHVSAQLLRSGTSPYFNHGEAQAAESPKDFIHKMRVCLKELRESKRARRLAHRANLVKPACGIEPALEETEELIRIFYTSIRTARRRLPGNEAD